MAQLKWIHKKFEEFDLNEFYRIAALRQAIFVVEQNCAYQDLDYKDFEAHHLVGYYDGLPVAYCRVYDRQNQFIHIGRVAVAKDYRGRQLAYALMEYAHSIIQEQFTSTTTIVISAQKYLQPFYRKLGYRKVGKEYLEDGIPHIEMRKSL